MSRAATVSWRQCILGYHAARPAPGYCLRNWRLLRKYPWWTSWLFGVVDTRTLADAANPLNVTIDGARVGKRRSDDVDGSLGIQVVMASMPRFQWVLNQTLTRLNTLDGIGAVHIFGYCPSLGLQKVRCHPFPNGTRAKLALTGLTDEEVPTGVLTSDGPFSMVDRPNRARWRSSIALDTWAVLGATLPLLGPNQDFLWMENDV